MNNKDFVPFEESPQKKQGKDPFHQPSKPLSDEIRPYREQWLTYPEYGVRPYREQWLTYPEYGVRPYREQWLTYPEYGVRPSREQGGSFDPRDTPPAKMYAPDVRVAWELGMPGSGVYMDTTSGKAPKTKPAKVGQDPTMRSPTKPQEPAAPEAVPKQQSKEGQPPEIAKIAQSAPTNLFYNPGPPDIHQQTITRTPMQNITELEVAAIQQQYGFQNAAFAQRLVAARYAVHNLYVAWYAEAQKSGDNVGAARKVGYDTTDPGRFSTTTPLDNPHPTSQGGYAYNTTLTAEADAYYRRIWAQELRQWETEVNEKKEQNRQAAAAAKEHQQQLTRQQQEQVYLSWGQSMNKSPQQRHDLAVLKQKISQGPKTAGAQDTPFVSLERSVNQQRSALMELTGEPVSDAVVEGIRNKLLFERYGEAKEIAIVGQALPQAERKGLDTLFNQLEPSREKKVSDDTDALYRRITGKEPERGDLTWKVCRNRLLREYYAGAGKPKVAQQQQLGSSTLSQATARFPGKITGELTIHGGQPTSGNRQSVGPVSGGAVQQGSVEPETPVQHFQRDLQQNAYSALESNRERLNQQQQQYQDPNPKSQYWQSLWKAKRTHDGLETRIRVLEAQAAKSAEDLSNQSDLPSLKSPEEGRNGVRQKELEGLAAQKTAQRQELALLKGYKLQTEYEFPALSAMGSEKANTRENNAQILGRIPQKFGEIRGSITDLEGQIQNDPKVALRLDKVVEKTLKDGGDSVEVRQWLASEQFWKNVGTAAGAVGTGVAVVAMLLNPEVGLLRWIAAGLGIGMAAAQLPDAIIEDRAAQSGRGGAKQVTSLDPDTARGNLTLAWVSLGVAGLDVGLQPEVVAQVVRLPGVARAALAMTKAQSKVFVASLAQVKGEVSEAAVQAIAAGVRKADGLTTAIVDNGDGTFSAVKGPLSKAADKMDEVAAATAARKKPRLQDMTPAERLVDAQGKYGQVKNWDEVQPLLGQTVDKSTKLPDGYVLYEKSPNFFGKRELFILQENGENAAQVPLMIENGKLQAGTARLSRGTDVMKRNLKAVGIDTPDGYQLNHLVPDAVAKNDPMIVEMLKRDIYDVDHAGNLLPMPGKVRGEHPDLVGHFGPHDGYNELVKQQLSRRKDDLIEEYGSLSKVPDKQLEDAVKGVENKMRKDIIKRSPNIPTRYDPATGTRVLSEGISDPDLVA